MKINIYSINKSGRDEYQLINKNLEKMIKKYATLKDISLFNKKIASSQNLSPIIAKKAYTEILRPYLKEFNIALDPKGKKIDSFEFAKLLENRNSINFFIGGAYGFEDEFLKECNIVISLSDLTFSHKISKIVLLEQIFRGFSILNNHPYHK